MASLSLGPVQSLRNLIWGNYPSKTGTPSAMKPKVSVVIPTYNDSEKLPRSVQSVLAQAYDNLEIIVVDDAGDHNVRRALGEHVFSDSRIVLHRHTENKMLGGARNTGIDISTGDYVFFLDADDRMLRSAIPVLVSEATRTNADVVQGGSLTDGRFNRAKLYHAAVFNSDGGVDGLDLFAKHQYASVAWNKLYRRSFLNDPVTSIRFTEKFMHEDVVFAARTAFHAKRIASISDPVVHYTVNAKSLTHKPMTRFSLESYLETYISLVRAIEEFGLNKSEHKNLVREIFAAHGSGDFGPKLARACSEMGPKMFSKELISVAEKRLGVQGVILGDIIRYCIAYQTRK